MYGTGGLASGRASANTFITQVGCPIGGCLAGSESKTFWGWAAGGGLEYAIGQWLVRAEYLHYDLGDLNYNVVDPFWDLLFGRR